jgi:gluconolactonase
MTAASGSPIPSTASAETTGFKSEQELKEAVYRVDPKTGQIDKATDEVGEPNGICFSPDYKKLYVADTGAARHQGARDRRQDAAQREAQCFDNAGTGAPSAADGIRCDADGNIWLKRGRACR